jgi:hypothetical protein
MIHRPALHPEPDMGGEAAVRPYQANAFVFLIIGHGFFLGQRRGKEYKEENKSRENTSHFIYKLLTARKSTLVEKIKGTLV